jgi:glycine oxidase
MTSTSTIVVAGAGAIGRTVAYGLARAGHAVTVVDPDPAGGLASRVAAGMLAPAFEALFDGGRFELLAEARGLWRSLAHEIGLPIAWDGAMALGTRSEAEAWGAALAALGAEAELRDLGGDIWAAYSDEDRQLDPELALELLQQAAEYHGARYVTGRVVGLADGLVEIEGAERIQADALVIATGAGQDLSQLAPELARLTPVKGHVLRTPVAFVGVPTVRAPGVYICRTERGTIVGATMEVGRSDTEVDPAMVQKLLADAGRLADGLGRRTWTAAAGVRAETPDGLPMVGCGATPGVILAVGARRNGWLLAPMIADVVLCAVEGRPKSPIAELFDPNRFSRG